MQELPHEVIAESETQDCPHACCSDGQEHVFVMVLHVAPEGQSELSRQPARQVRVMGSQEKPAPQRAPGMVQSVGRFVHAPAMQTCAPVQPRPHCPQLLGSF